MAGLAGVIGAEAILEHLSPWLLVVARVAGLFLATPALSGRLVPRRAKVVIALAFGAAIYPLIPAASRTAPEADLFSLVPLLAAETLIGLAIGLIAMLPLTALELAGSIMGYQMGLGLARLYNPDLDVDTEPLGQLLFMVGFAAFLSMGGLDAAFAAVATTFDRVPPGAARGIAPPLDLLIGVAASGFETALRMALPVLASVFIVLLALGVASKTMPQLNIMGDGFAVKIMLGLGTLAAAIWAIEHAATDEIARAVGAVSRWAAGLAPP